MHTDLGLAFRNARVNGAIVPLDYELQNGDVVEIQKHSSPHPSPQWMQHLKMSSSKSKLKRYLYALERPAHIAHGRELVNEEFRKRGLPPLTTDLGALRLCDGQVLTMDQREDILMKIGQGAEKAASLPLRLTAVRTVIPAPDLAEQKADSVRQALTGREIVAMEGNLSMPVRFAKCCEPAEWPREDIVGNISRNGSVMIHRENCNMFKSTNPERRVGVWWR